MCEGETSFCRVFLVCGEGGGMCEFSWFTLNCLCGGKKNFHRAANDLQCLTSNLLAQCSVYQAVVLQASG